MTRPGPAPELSALKGRRVLIALSGGADSVALACMLAEARDRLGLTLFAAHLDHGIRPESAADAEWCRALCARLDISFYTVRMDVPALAARDGEGLETAARRARYGWLRALKAELGADCIALAHHMDDQAETVLMHLARGAGPEGVGGMSPVSKDLVRPLLGLRKSELSAYLERIGVGWREDATNAVADTPRNALRLHGIPALEKSYPQFVPAVARYAESARLESDYVSRQADAWLKASLVRGPWGECLLLEDPPHPALLRRAIRALCPGDVGWEKLRQASALAERARGVLEMPGGLRLERGRRGLYFLHGDPPTIPETPLALNGTSRLPGVCEIDAAPSLPLPIRGDPLCQALDAAALEGAALRTRRPGDRIRPLGCGDRLLSDYLTDRKVDRPLRDFIPLLVRGGRVLWVCGLGIAEEVKLTEGTQRALRLECRFEFENII